MPLSDREYQKLVDLDLLNQRLPEIVSKLSAYKTSLEKNNLEFLDFLLSDKLPNYISIQLKSRNFSSADYDALRMQSVMPKLIQDLLSAGERGSITKVNIQFSRIHELVCSYFQKKDSSIIAELEEIIYAPTQSVEAVEKITHSKHPVLRYAIHCLPSLDQDSYKPFLFRNSCKF